jgi:hypothetical protein
MSRTTGEMLVDGLVNAGVEHLMDTATASLRPARP